VSRDGDGFLHINRLMYSPTERLDGFECFSDAPPIFFIYISVSLVVNAKRSWHYLTNWLILSTQLITGGVQEISLKEE
jgi:hypothetical protein